MNAREALKAINVLCDKMCALIDTNTEKMSALEKRVADLEKRNAVLLNISQVSKATGWSVAAVAKWVDTKFIESVRVEGLKKPLIPSTEVEKILSTRGYGKKYGGDK